MEKIQVVVTRGKMPDRTPRTQATRVQIEDWRGCMSPGFSEFCVACYPISNEYRGPFFWKNRWFRLALWFETMESAEACFAKLTDGSGKIEDYRAASERPELIDCVMDCVALFGRV